MPLSRRQFVKGAAAATLLADITAIQATAAQESRDIKASARNLGDRLISPDEYSLSPDVNYLNHASIGTVPIAVQKAHEGYLRLCEHNPWLYMWSDPWQEPRENVRAQLAELLNCGSTEIAITHNTTEVFNTLANGLPLGSRDEVLFSSLNHAGASVCWEHRSVENGFSVRRFDFPISDAVNLTEDEVVSIYERQIGPRTTVLALPHIDNTIGLRHPLKKIASMAHAKGVRWVVVDGAQTAGMIPVDLPDTGVDVYATSAHKWIQSPKGLGVAYFKQSIMQDIAPMWVTWGQKRWDGTARVFEDYGTRALAGVLALGDALKFQQTISMSDREAHHKQLWTDTQEIVDSNGILEWRGTREWAVSGAVYAIEVKGRKSSDVARKLFEDHGTIVRPFSSDEINTIRISPNVMNNLDDFKALVEALG